MGLEQPQLCWEHTLTAHPRLQDQRRSSDPGWLHWEPGLALTQPGPLCAPSPEMFKPRGGQAGAYRLPHTPTRKAAWGELQGARQTGRTLRTFRWCFGASGHVSCAHWEMNLLWRCPQSGAGGRVGGKVGGGEGPSGLCQPGVRGTGWAGQVHPTLPLTSLWLRHHLAAQSLLLIHDAHVTGQPKAPRAERLKVRAWALRAEMFSSQELQVIRASFPVMPQPWAEPLRTRRPWGWGCPGRGCSISTWSKSRADWASWVLCPSRATSGHTRGPPVSPGDRPVGCVCIVHKLRMTCAFIKCWEGE